jgi:uncharacterized cupredoxin-like copper-binding protein
MKRFLPALVVAGFVAVALLTGGLVAAAGGEPTTKTTALGPGDVTVVLTVEHSRFVPDEVAVRTGTSVRFVVDNQDPIGHELIVGPEEVHELHELGTHGRHPPVPGEVSVPANAEADTTYEFAAPGDVVFACHLPGHFSYGMRGVVRVVRP